MKKTALILLGTVSCLQAEQVTPNYFNGFYAGTQIGAMWRTDKTDYKGESGFLNRTKFTLDSLNTSKSTTNFASGLFGGYGRCFGDFYLGLEGYIEHSTSEKDNTYNIAGNMNGNVPLKGKLKTTYERGVVFGWAPRIGMVINQNLAYVKLGFEVSRDKIKHRTTDIKATGRSGHWSDTEKLKTKTQFVFVPGFGYERAFGKIIARIEYSFNCGGKISFDDGSIKYSAHILKVGFAWKF